MKEFKFSIPDEVWEHLLITPAAARINAGMTQTDAADRIGISVGTLAAIEQGTSSPTLAVLKRIEAAYGRPYAFIRFN